MTDLILVVILLLIVGSAIFYIKKKNSAAQPVSDARTPENVPKDVRADAAVIRRKNKLTVC